MSYACQFFRLAFICVKSLRDLCINVLTVLTLKTLQQEFPSPKHLPPIEEQTGVIYKTPCKECDLSYIGEAGRSFLTKKKEHVRSIKLYTQGSTIAIHVWDNNHKSNFENACIIERKLQNTKNFRIIAHWNN